MTPAAVSLELLFSTQAMRLLKARVEALQEQGIAMARGGKALPHHKVVHGEGRTKWSKPDAEVIALGQMLGINFAKPQEAITPLQARAKGLPDPLFTAFCTRSTGAAELAEDDGSEYRRVFT